MSKYNQNDLSKDQKSNYNKHGSVAQGLVAFDIAVAGPGVVQEPENRIMTGAISSAHGAEQLAAVAAAGGMVQGHAVSETGKVVR